METMATRSISVAAQSDGTSILVVDDDQAYREAVGRLLERSGHVVAVAGN